MSVAVKICGLTDAEAMDAAIEAGADYLGLVFFAKSPRALSPEQAAELTQFIEGVTKVGLFVDPDDGLLDQVLAHVRLDMIQLHGAETPERVGRIRDEYALPVMKVVPVATADDLAAADLYADVADMILFDARPPKDAALPGGNAIAFDWTILKNYRGKLPWMLAGGLTPANVAEAIKVTGAQAVDVSSGVETAPGIKDPDKIRAFIQAAQGG